MKIISNYHYQVSNNRNLKQTNNKTKEFLNSTNTIKSGHSLSFSGIFQFLTPPKDKRYLTKDVQMLPNQPYLISNDAVLVLGPDFILDLGKDELIKSKIDNLKSGQSLVFGREAIALEGMDKKVSRKHLKIKKNNNGELIAFDLGSTNGTKICKNLIIPEINQGAFKLQPNMKYILPENAVLGLPNKTKLPLYQFREYLKQMSPQQSITIGCSPENSLHIDDNRISRQHLRLKNCANGVIVEDLNSTNGTIFIGVEKILPYKDDYSKIQKKLYLQPNTPTLIPNDCQLYLGENFTIDLRNSNILDLLNNKGAITVGRDNSCDLIIDNFYTKASKKHLKLEKAEDKIVATDLNSTNKTQVIPKNQIEPFYGDIGKIELKQGNIGDCYLLSTIYAMSRTPYGQKLLKNMVRVDDSGNYIVTFNSRAPIVVAPNELDGQKKGDKEKISVSGDLGVKAIERAYGKMLKAGKMNGIEYYNPTMFFVIDQGGWMNKALEKMTNLACKKTKINSDSIEDILTYLSRAKDKYILTCSTYNTGNYGKFKDYMDPEQRFISQHAYAIESIDSKNEKITIINPHNTMYSYTISWDEFKKYFDYICYANVSGK